MFVIRLTPPWASDAIISFNQGVASPAAVARPSQVAVRTKRFFNDSPLIELSSNSALLIDVPLKRPIKKNLDFCQMPGH